MGGALQQTQLDFLVIVASILNYTPLETGNLGRVFRLGRCLRPLRMINRNESMKIIITAVIDRYLHDCRSQLAARCLFLDSPVYLYTELFTPCCHMVAAW